LREADLPLPEEARRILGVESTYGDREDNPTKVVVTGGVGDFFSKREDGVITQVVVKGGPAFDASGLVGHRSIK
jgi:hypothetical protein